MVITQKDFNKHMDSYINNMSKHAHFSGNKRIKKNDQRVLADLDDDKIHIEKKERISDKLFNRQPKLSEEDFEMNKVTKESQDDQDFNDETEDFELKQNKEKKGFFASIKDMFSFKKETSDEDVPVEDLEKNTVQIKTSGNDDLKSLAKITYRLLERLSEDQVTEFKASKDYSDYKAILDRNKLLKKK